MRLYESDVEKFQTNQKRFARLFRKNFSIIHEHYLLDDPEFTHDLLSIMENKKANRFRVNIGDEIAELRRTYRRQQDFHRTVELWHKDDIVEEDEEPKPGLVVLDPEKGLYREC